MPNQPILIRVAKDGIKCVDLLNGDTLKSLINKQGGYVVFLVLSEYSTMRTNLLKLLDLLIFWIYSLNFSLEFFIMITFTDKNILDNSY